MLSWRSLSVLFAALGVVVAACGPPGGEATTGGPKAVPAADPMKATGTDKAKFECFDDDALRKRDSAFASFKTIDTTLDAARRPALPARTVADKFAFAVNDHDGDGIDDDYDLCPNSNEDGKEPHPFDGCPKDEDHTRGRPVWPDLPMVVVKADRLEIAEQVHFATGSARILDASKQLISAIAQAVLENPDIELVEVAGHADKQGNAKENLTLTQQRAKSVVDALVAKGVSPKWLRSMGYGSHCPIDPGSTKEALAKNRRVEFRIIQRNGKDLTPTWGGCEEAEKQGIRRPATPPHITRPKPNKPEKPTQPGKPKGAPEFQGSCRTPHAAECEQHCRAGSTESCYVGAHERAHSNDSAVITSDRETLKRECEQQQYFPACSQLAVSLLSDAPQDHATALSLATGPCEKGDGVACGVAALLLQRGCMVPPDQAKGYALAKKGCTLDIEQANHYMSGSRSVGDRLACAVASRAMWFGLGGPKDHAGAYAMDLRACAVGLKNACVRVAQDAMNDPAVVSDRNKLVAILHDVCEEDGWSNATDSCLALANIEKPGEYTSPRLCDAGGQLECAKKCEAKDWEQCFDLYVSAHYKGFYQLFDSLSPRAWVLRGLIEEAKTDHYRDSQAKTDEAAADYYNKACIATVPSGCIHHARMRLEGRGTFRDPGGAAQALEEWCKKGEKMACAFLAHASATKKIPGGALEAQRNMAEACKAGLKRVCK